MPKRKRTPDIPKGLTAEALEGINSIHPDRHEFYKAHNLNALDSYVKGWLMRATRHKFKGEAKAHPAWVASQVRAWASKGRPYKYNGYWETVEGELPDHLARQQTAPPLQKTRRRRRRKTA